MTAVTAGISPRWGAVADQSGQWRNPTSARWPFVQANRAVEKFQETRLEYVGKILLDNNNAVPLECWGGVARTFARSQLNRFTGNHSNRKRT